MGTKSDRSSGSQFNPRGVVQGTTLVCHKSGNPVDCVVDETGIRRLAVDSIVTIDAQNIQVAVELEAENDSVRIEDPNTGAHVRVEPDGSINVNANINLDAKDGDNIAISGHLNPIFDEGVDTITTATFEQIYRYTSTNDDTRLLSIECSVSTPAVVRLKIDGNIVRLRRTSALERNTVFKFNEHRPLSNGQVITVEAQVERLIKSSYTSFTSLEGYLCT